MILKDGRQKSNLSGWKDI